MARGLPFCGNALAPAVDKLIHGGSGVGSDANLGLEAGATNTGVDDGGRIGTVPSILDSGVEYVHGYDVYGGPNYP